MESSCLVANEQREKTHFSASFHLFILASVPNPFGPILLL